MPKRYNTLVLLARWADHIRRVWARLVPWGQAPHALQTGLAAPQDGSSVHTWETENLAVNLSALTPDSPRQVHVTPLGTAYVDYAGVRYINRHGVEHFVGRDGQLVLNMPGSTRIQIEDATGVVEHNAVRIHQTTSHTMVFNHGGVLAFLMDDQKTMLEVHVRNMNVSTEEAGVLKVPAQAT